MASVGQHGLSRRKFSGINPWHFRDYMDQPEKYNDMLAMHFEAPRYDGNNFANLYRGWFIAPSSTNYRFYTVCDDHCAMRIAITPDQTAETQEMLDVDNWTE